MKKCVFLTSIMVLAIFAVCARAEGIGPEIITLETGRMPQVSLPHHMHQEKLNNDCNACHDLFPKQKGAIKEMIAMEKLKKQQVMKSKCIKCHKDRRNKGLEAGPVKCMECHVRPR